MPRCSSLQLYHFCVGKLMMLWFTNCHTPCMICSPVINGPRKVCVIVNWSMHPSLQCSMAEKLIQSKSPASCKQDLLQYSLLHALHHFRLELYCAEYRLQTQIGGCMFRKTRNSAIARVQQLPGHLVCVSPHSRRVWGHVPPHLLPEKFDILGALWCI